MPCRHSVLKGPLAWSSVTILVIFFTMVNPVTTETLYMQCKNKQMEKLIFWISLFESISVGVVALQLHDHFDPCSRWKGWSHPLFAAAVSQFPTFATITVCAALQWAKLLEHKLFWGVPGMGTSWKTMLFLHNGWKQCAGNAQLWYFSGNYFMVYYAKKLIPLYSDKNIGRMKPILVKD